MTLLEKALNSAIKKRKNHKFNEEQKELAMAWAMGKINNNQVSAAVGYKNNSNVYPFLALVLSEIMREQKSKEEL